MTVRILQGDVLDTLRSLPDGSVQCVVTSPPYWGLRDYGVAGQLGSEATPAEYIAAMVEVFSEVWRVLRDDGICWLNMGDSYASHDPGGYRPGEFLNPDGRPPVKQGVHRNRAGTYRPEGLKPKDLVGMPWMLAFALRDWGWWLRRDVIWDKPNPMPESVSDRPGTAHEYIFMLTKSGSTKSWVHRDRAGSRTLPAPDHRWVDLDASDLDAVEGNKVQKPTGWASGPGAHGNVNAAGRSEAIYHAAEQRLVETAVEPENWRTEKSINRPGKKRWRRINLWSGCDYFWDMEAVRVAGAIPAGTRGGKASAARAAAAGVSSRPPEYKVYSGKRNIRSVWRITTVPYTKAHFATFPPALPERCIKAASSEVGCCAACGAPWARGISVDYVKNRPSAGNDSRTRGEDKFSVGNDTKGFRGNNLLRQTETLGWLPTCQCNAGDPVPCVVLDPFGGAGTTGLVADRLGRDAILVELKSGILRDGAAAADR